MTAVPLLLSLLQLLLCVGGSISGSFIVPTTHIFCEAHALDFLSPATFTMYGWR
jgi:hypothetical protein